MPKIPSVTTKYGIGLLSICLRETKRWEIRWIPLASFPKWEIRWIPLHKRNQSYLFSHGSQRIHLSNDDSAWRIIPKVTPTACGKCKSGTPCPKESKCKNVPAGVGPCWTAIVPWTKLGGTGLGPLLASGGKSSLEGHFWACSAVVTPCRTSSSGRLSLSQIPAFA